ncbi:hypothetical protein UG56_020020 [Nocardioides luteus]|uniref:Fenitrothion hydrolase n=2 Tax=Nocardioides luteus TaxID=1844 RepID=A0A1J4N0C8_9ACTN|nr:hypothetical protein UG56_020020 [Nocardioides luteus]
MHGLGGGADLPIPAPLAIAGGTAALALSFLVLLLAWRTPRFATTGGERTVHVALAAFLDSRGWTLTIRTLGMTFFCFMLWPALFGPDLLNNPTFGVVYVWLWVGIVPASLLFGRFYRAVSPARTLHLFLAKVAGRPPGEGIRRYPAQLGYWPAAIGLFAFVWLELVSPQANYLGSVRAWFACYLAAMLLGGAIFGERWLERADPFEVYSTLLAHLSPWAHNDEGDLVWISPLRHLARVPGEAGLVATVAVLLASTAYDSWRESVTWIRFVQSSGIDQTVLGTAGLLTAVTVVGVVFMAASMATRVEESVDRWQVPRQLAHSIVPIVVGYMVAHYLSFFVQVGSQTLIQISDPIGTGANLFGTGGWEVNYWFSQHATFLATTKVVSIVTGHVLGVIAAHDRSLEILPRRHQVAGQLPLLVAMVLYTYMGLYLLFGA